ncbi:MAG: hypothetical protein IKN74_04470 [Clostridia bacterium]|nr:hypothetical protein [Clostridia bacterium]
MPKMKCVDDKLNELNVDLVFSFNIPELKSGFAVVDNQAPIFEKNSMYNNLDILRIVSTENNTITLTDLTDEEWPEVKKALQFQVFEKF